MAQMAKMLGGQGGGQPQPAQTNPGTGANQMSKIMPPQQAQQQPQMGQPNQDEYKKLINRFAGGNQNGGQQG
jgi:hypothetical protein